MSPSTVRTSKCKIASAWRRDKIGHLQGRRELELHQGRWRLPVARKGSRRGGQDVRPPLSRCGPRCEFHYRFIVVADYRKNSTVLGTSYTAGVPIEVSPFAHTSVLHSLRTMIGSPNAALRMARAKAGPVVTDNGNFIIDAPFSEAALRNPRELLVSIKLLTGVVEVGIFCNVVKAAYFGNQDGSVSARFVNGETAQIKSGD